ncbi:hypothetical protein BDV93DRAFT_547015 [Ceratobasidium sp. AG-I]|nr:hypothetical protein BDV93DRAFT_547015 [Ceratobasidium sp. AG-I]
MPSSTMQSPRSKMAGGPPPTSMPQPQHKRSSLRYSLNHLGKAIADVVGKESKLSSAPPTRAPSAIPTLPADRSASSLSQQPPAQGRRPSIAGAFDTASRVVSGPPPRGPPPGHIRSRTLSTTNGLTQHKASTASPKRASPTKLAASATAPAVAPVSRRRSLMVKGALAAPAASAAPATNTSAPIGATKMLIRPKTAIPRSTPPEDDRVVEVKERERRTESPRAPHAAVGRTRERHDSRASPVRSPSTLPVATPKGRASPVRTSSNDQTPTAGPKDEREKRRERREREKKAQEEREKEKQRERAKQLEVEKAQEVPVQRASSSGHRTSSSTTTLTSASSIFTSGSRSSTGDSLSSNGGSAKRTPPSSAKAHTTVFPRTVLTPPDDEEGEDEDITISTPMTRSRTATGSTTFGGDISTPAISKTLLATISSQTESPILAPLDQRLRHSGSITSMNSSLPSPIHPGTMAFPPPAHMRSGGNAANKHTEDDDEDWEEGDVSALLETVASPIKGQATPAMPRFSIKSSARSRMPDPRTPSRGNLPTREALSYASPAVPASIQRVKGDKAGTRSNLSPAQQRGPRESILSWDALVERSRLEEGDLEDILRAPPPAAVGLISPDMRPARSLPFISGMGGPKRMNLAGISDSEAEIEEEREGQGQGGQFFTPGTANGNMSTNGQSISQVLFPPPASPEKKSKSKTKEREREFAEKERAWAEKEEAFRTQQAEWEAQRTQWEVEREQWVAQQNQWSTQRGHWNAQQMQWSTQKAQWEARSTEWTEREDELNQAIQMRDQELEDASAHIEEMEKRAKASNEQAEVIQQQAEVHKKQAHELRAAKEREARMGAQVLCVNALNAWTGVGASLKADAAACAADRAALQVILMGLEAMTCS